MQKEKMGEEWMLYDGNYCKTRQDIRLKSGREIINCWPNAGFWARLSGMNEQIPDNQITHVRLTKEEKIQIWDY